MNRVILVGRVGKNPEITFMPNSGKELARFTMVTNEGYYNHNKEWQESSEWHNLVAWGLLAQKIEKNVKMGDMILIEGKLRSRKWKDQGGNDRKVTEIEASTMVVLVKKRDATGETTTPRSVESGSPAGFPDTPQQSAGSEEMPEMQDISYEEDPF
jgi:single-strand DNA-binding protein